MKDGGPPGQSAIRNPQSEIILGLRFVRSLSGWGIGRIIAGRRGRPYRTLDELRRAARLSEPELVNLIRCGACDGLGEHRGAMLAEAELESPVGELLAEVGAVGANAECGIRNSELGISNQAYASDNSAFRIPNSEFPRFPWTRPFTELEKFQAEIDVLGLFLAGHPMDLVRGDWITTDQLPRRVGQRVAVAGVLDATRTTATSRGDLMRFVTLEDRAGLVECTLFPQAYQRFGHLFYHLGPFRVAGVVENDRGAVTVAADFAESLVDTSPLKLPQELYPPSQIV